MREPSEMYTVSRMQSMVQARKKSTYSAATRFLCVFFTFRALGVESPRGGAMMFSGDMDMVVNSREKRAYESAGHETAKRLDWLKPQSCIIILYII